MAYYQKPDSREWLYYLGGKYIYLILLGLIASFFMFYQLGRVPPPYPWLDEASAGQDAVSTLGGAISLYYPDQGGGGNLWTYLASLMFLFTGPNLIVLRWLAGMVGVLSVLFVFSLFSELLRTFMPLKRAQTFAFLAALWMSVSTWHISMSRVAWPPSLVPLIVTVTFLFFWRGLRTGRLRDMLGLGVGLGLSVYLYLPGRFIVFVPLLFLILEVVIGFIQKTQPVRRNVYRMLLTSGGVAFIIALPMLLLYISTPEAFVGRAVEVYALNEGTTFDKIIQGLNFHADAFGFTFNLLRSPFERLILGSITTVFFLIGLLITIFRIAIPVNRFMILWWMLLLVPSIVAPPPNSIDMAFLRRPIASLPITFIFPVMSLEFLLAKIQTSGILKQSMLVVRVIVFSVAVTVISLTAWQTIDDFFIKWGNSPGAYQAFDPTNTQLVQWMNAHTTPDTAFVFPTRSIKSTSTQPWIFTIHFLFKGVVYFIPDHEDDIPDSLLKAISGKSEVYLLTEDRNGADAKGIFPYLLHRLGRLDRQESSFGFTIEHYQLIHQTLDNPVKQNIPQVVFGNELLLQKSKMGVIVDGDRRLFWSELVWENLVSKTDYQVTIRLEDTAGHIIAQQDKLLLNNLYWQSTSNWEAQSVEKDYYWFEIPPDILPHDYLLRVGVYNPTTGQMLLPEMGDTGTDLTLLLETMPIKSPDTFVQKIDPKMLIKANFRNSNLILVGLDGQLPETLSPGQSIQLPVLLQFDKEMSDQKNLQLALALVENFWPLSQPVSLSLADNWPIQVPFQIFLDGKIPRDIQAGRYLLVLCLLNIDTRCQPVNTATLGEIEIFSREHQFGLPPVDYNPIESDFFGAVVDLLGYRLDSNKANSDGIVELVLYWHSLATTDVSYKVFIHLIDAEGQIVTQVDREPQNGNALTTSWITGEIITDRIEIPIESRLADVQTIAVGLYNPIDGKRLAVGNDNKIILTLPSR